MKNELPPVCTVCGFCTVNSEAEMSSWETRKSSLVISELDSELGSFQDRSNVLNQPLLAQSKTDPDLFVLFLPPFGGVMTLWFSTECLVKDYSVMEGFLEGGDNFCLVPAEVKGGANVPLGMLISGEPSIETIAHESLHVACAYLKAMGIHYFRPSREEWLTYMQGYILKNILKIIEWRKTGGYL